MASSHILYDDDFMLFCKGNSSNIKALSTFFDRYAQISGQVINPLKSTIYGGSISHQRLTHIVGSLGFSIGTMPFIYLGVPIFKGKQPLVNKIKLKLSFPVILCIQLERYMRNFLWSGDLENKKLVTVSWSTVCTPVSEGGLGLRSIPKINEAFILKLCWDILHSEDQWDTFLKSRVTRGPFMPVQIEENM
ncbi:hypothetical protein KIW84_045654 [Lathyrus oleraceus]|uniref:Reverse transcriptase domain-containing protein n=1 Tax=Pisum sativum TaxID=3888 RepID=A0A9D5AS17_PEA|nr:hypothetical protein KIW84_045654 [Pisum sativum]